MRVGHRQDYHYAIMGLLCKSPLTVTEAAEKLGCSEETSSRVLKLLRQHGAAHICAYRREGMAGPPSAVYRIGQGVEADMPPAKTQSEKCKAWRAKQQPAPSYGFWGI